MSAATVADFNRWENRAARMPISGLVYSAADAYKAARALDSHDPEGADRYRDEAMTYEGELRARVQKGDIK